MPRRSSDAREMPGVEEESFESLMIEGLRDPRIGGRDHVNLDNAATTPPLRSVRDAVCEFLPFYGSVHRGAGVKSRLTTEVYERAREVVASAFGADPARHATVFVRNTTEAMNLLARLVEQDPDAFVVTSETEHNSNLLPWRRREEERPGLSRSVVLGLGPDHRVDLNALEDTLHRHPGPHTLVALGAASNVTGAVLDLFAITSLTNRYGCELAVDAAQWAPHRPIDMASMGIDYLAVSGHKTYAPFGAGVLIARRDRLERSEPLLVGGGTAALVTDSAVLLSPVPDRFEAGSPNVLGALAFAVALETLAGIGWERIMRHEAALLSYLEKRMAEVPGVMPYAPPGERVGVFAFRLAGLPSDGVATALAEHANVAVRSGCFCAHLLVARLTDADLFRDARAARGLRDVGLVRASLGLYNTVSDVDRLVEGLTALAEDPGLGLGRASPPGAAEGSLVERFLGSGIWPGAGLGRSRAGPAPKP